MAKTPDIEIARVHDDATDTGRARLLVDGIWPRGVSKDALVHDDWIKDIAPSTDLRKWFGHDPDKWGAFRNRYLHELSGNPDAVDRCLDWCRKGPVTLLYAARDRDHNQAVVLKDYLTQRLKGDP